MPPDYQKREAKQSLWDWDGHHIPKRYRNKGKGRGKDKRLIKEALVEMILEPDLDIQDARNRAFEESHYCYHYGPCERCKECL